METDETPKKRRGFRFFGRVLKASTGGLKVQKDVSSSLYAPWPAECNLPHNVIRHIVSVMCEHLCRSVFHILVAS